VILKILSDLVNNEGRYGCIHEDGPALLEALSTFLSARNQEGHEENEGAGDEGASGVNEGEGEEDQKTSDPS
jgi:hypothetical protein